MLDYDEFAEIIANGKAQQGATGQRVMPSFGTDQNVMLLCRRYLRLPQGPLRRRSWTAAGRNVSRSDAPQRHGDLKCRQDAR